MVLGRLTHYAFDALAISTILAGIKKTTGFAPATNLIPDTYFKSMADSYFGMGETIFSVASGQAVTNSYFKKE